VVTSAGDAVGDAEVSVYDMSIASQETLGALERRVQSASDGSFEVPHLRGGMKRLIVIKTGYARDGREPLEVPKRTSDTKPLVLVLTQGFQISGLVRDQATRLPVANARVGARPVGNIRSDLPVVEPGNPDLEREFPSGAKPGETSWVKPIGSGGIGDFTRIPQFEITGETDADGRFVIRDVPEALFTLQVQAAGYLYFSGRTAKSGASDLVFELTKSPRAKGRVIDALTGAAVKEFRIVPAVSNVNNWMPNTGEQFENEDGTFDLTIPRPGNWFLHVQAPGYAIGTTESLTFLMGQTTADLTIPMQRGATVRGYVKNSDGAAISDAVVELLPGMASDGGNPFAALFRTSIRRSNLLIARTTDGGSFEIANVPPGDYRIEAAATGYSKVESAGFTLQLNQEYDAPALTVTRGGRVEGVVVTDGKLDSLAIVMLTRDDPKLFQSQVATTDSSGRYVFQGLQPGNYRLTVTQRNGAIQLGNLIQSQGVPDGVATVRDGQTVEVNF
jgi:hypothetical protein